MMLHQLSNSHSCACAAEIASRVKYGQQTFLRFPENLLNSRARYAKAFQVSFFSSDVCLCSGCLLVCLSNYVSGSQHCTTTDCATLHHMSTLSN